METPVQELRSRKDVRSLLVVVMIAVIVALGAYAYITIKQARYAGFGPNIINVQGEGEVFARPDIATFTFSVTAEAADPATAQAESATAINAITEYLHGEGIEDRDVRTAGYYLSPKYEWVQPACVLGMVCPSGRQNLVGYTVSQTIEVKVRDTNKAGDLIAGVGSRGATDVSGLAFTIDDTDALKAEAREQAIEEARAKAKALAESLGVRLVRMTGYWEEVPSPYPYYGGGYGLAESALNDMARTAPSLPGGENTIVSRVNISYEIR